MLDSKQEEIAYLEHIHASYQKYPEDTIVLEQNGLVIKLMDKYKVNYAPRKSGKMPPLCSTCTKKQN